MLRCRRAFLRARAAADAIQAAWRGRQCRLSYAALLRRHRAALLIQAVVRGNLQRRRFRCTLAAIVVIQAAWRRRQVRQRAAAEAAARRQAAATLHAAGEEQRRREAENEEEESSSWDSVQRDFGMDAGGIRRVLLLWKQHGDAFMQWQQNPQQQPVAVAGAQGPPSGVGAALAGEDSGVLLRMAAASADEQQQRLEQGQRLDELERTVSRLHCPPLEGCAVVAALPPSLPTAAAAVPSRTTVVYFHVLAVHALCCRPTT